MRKILVKEPGRGAPYLTDADLAPGLDGKDGHLVIKGVTYRPKTNSAGSTGWTSLIIIDPVMGRLADKADRPKELQVETTQFQIFIACFKKTFQVAQTRLTEKKRREQQKLERERELLTCRDRANLTPHEENSEFVWCKNHSEYEFLHLSASIRERFAIFGNIINDPARIINQQNNVCLTEIWTRAQENVSSPLMPLIPFVFSVT